MTEVFLPQIYCNMKANTTCIIRQFISLYRTFQNVIGMSWSESPDGPWHRFDTPVLKPGKPGKFVESSTKRAHIESYGDFDSHKVHDPNLIVRNN